MYHKIVEADSFKNYFKRYLTVKSVTIFQLHKFSMDKTIRSNVTLFCRQIHDHILVWNAQSHFFKLSNRISLFKNYIKDFVIWTDILFIVKNNRCLPTVCEILKSKNNEIYKHFSFKKYFLKWVFFYIINILFTKFI